MKKKIIPLFVASLMVVTSLPVHAAENDAETSTDVSEQEKEENSEEDEPSVYKKSGNEISVDDTEITLAKAVEMAEEGVETVITLTEDIVVEKEITISSDKEIVFDMQGHKVTVDGSLFTGRIFINEGSLKITGNGTIDVSAAGANGYGSVNNYGYLEVNGGIYITSEDATAVNFYNRTGGTAYFYDATVIGSEGCVASEKDTKTYIRRSIY